MYNEELETLIDAALADGVLTEKEKQILFKKAQTMGIDLDEFEMVLDARLVKLKKAEQEKIAASSAPKSNKLGDVKKCPVCGAIVQSFQGVCSDCGYAFEDTIANTSVRELANLLVQSNGEYQMKKIINAFPIPLQKGALIEFITWLRPISLDFNNPLSELYQHKYEECIWKIKAAFSNDKELLQFVSDYNDDKKKIKKHQRISSIKKALANLGSSTIRALKWILTRKGFWIIIGILILIWVLDAIFIIF